MPCLRFCANVVLRSFSTAPSCRVLGADSVDVESCFGAGLLGFLWSASSASFCDVRFCLMFRGGFPDSLSLSVGSCWHCCRVYCLRLVVFRFPAVFFIKFGQGVGFCFGFVFLACFSSGLCLRLSVWVACLAWVAVFSALLAVICVLAGGRVSLLGKDTSLKKSKAPWQLPPGWCGIATF